MRKILILVISSIMAGCTTSPNDTNVHQNLVSHNDEKKFDKNKNSYSPPVYSGCKRPSYPFESMRSEEEGTTGILFVIGIDGVAIDTKIEKSSGYDRLDQTAIQALVLCKFNPLIVDGVPKKSWTAINYVWKLPPK